MKFFNILRYFVEFVIIFIFLIIFKLLGLNLSSFISSKIFRLIGHFFRSEKIITQNITQAFPLKSKIEIKKISQDMWKYYGRILAEYVYLKKFREDEKNTFIEIKGEEILNDIKNKNENVIFVSGHFDNFELMALSLEKSGINLSTIYRPLNNFLLNSIMESLRKKYICKNQIKKGRANIRNLIKNFKGGSSVALMIDQRVSEGIKSNFFNKDAYTTTIPAQFVRKYNTKIVPIHIERTYGVKFKLEVFKPIEFKKNEDIETITNELNNWLEKMILRNPSQWIWSHNRWK